MAGFDERRAGQLGGGGGAIEAGNVCLTMVVAYTVAFPGVQPERVVGMRADVVIAMMLTRARLMREAQRAVDQPPGENTMTSRITSVEQLKAFFSKPT